MAAITEDFSPVTQGDTLTPFAPVIQQRDPATGNLVPFPLTGLTITMKLTSKADATVVKTCSGPWVIDDPVNGRCHYTYQAGDVDTPGLWVMSLKFTNGLGAFVHGDTKVLQVLPAP